MTVHLSARECWSSPGGTAQIWAAPNDPGTAPDTTLTIDAPDCGPTTPQQPVIEGHTAGCKVPKLKGLTLKKAKAKLKRAHCSLGKATKKRSRVRKGRVIAQTPKPGAVRKNGARVNVVVSRGQ